MDISSILKSGPKRRGLWKKIEDLILEQVGSDAAGEAKLRNAVHGAAVWLAAQTKIPIPDALEAGFYQTVLWLPVQAIYDRLKDQGKV